MEESGGALHGDPRAEAASRKQMSHPASTQPFPYGLEGCHLIPDGTGTHTQTLQPEDMVEELKE